MILPRKHFLAEQIARRRLSRFVMKFLWPIFLMVGCAHQPIYPKHWWEPLPEELAYWWEVPPQAAKINEEVILSKRNELGILSNFAATPFIFHGKKYASVEGFWQMMKYPENKKDQRAQWKLKYTREQVSQMTALEAKLAGDDAEKIMKEKGVDWVTYEGKKMVYCQEEKGEHYHLIREAMKEKLKQNPEVKKILVSTGKLKLRADHQEESCSAPEWKYYQLWMEIRGFI